MLQILPAGVVTVAYIGATILFILALGGLSHPETARRGNLFGIIGMSVALLATIFGVVTGNYALLVGALAIGGADDGDLLRYGSATHAAPSDSSLGSQPDPRAVAASGSHSRAHGTPAGPATGQPHRGTADTSSAGPCRRQRVDSSARACLPRVVGRRRGMGVGTAAAHGCTRVSVAGRGVPGCRRSRGRGGPRHRRPRRSRRDRPGELRRWYVSRQDPLA